MQEMNSSSNSGPPPMSSQDYSEAEDWQIFHVVAKKR